MTPAKAEPQVPRRTFEAMFNEAGVPLDDALREKLRAVGLDLQNLRPSYPLPVLRLMFKVVRQHHFPHLGEDEGLRELGRRWVAGFKQTAIGFVFRTTAPLFGTDRTLQTLPRYLSAARDDMPLRVYVEGVKRYRLLCADPDASPHFLAGCLEGVLLTCGEQTARVEVKPAASGIELEVSWA